MTTTRTPSASAKSNAAALVQAWCEWSDAGCHVHPCKADGSKYPVSVDEGSHEIDDATGKRGWGYGRIRDGDLPAITLDQFAEMLKAGTVDGFGVFCGPPSGELEMLEIEGRAVELLAKVKAYADEHGDDAPDVLDRVSHGCVQRSPSGGIHFLYRVDGDACGNVVLAARPNDTTKNGRLVLAETRGTGGWFVAAPSGGRTHKSGRPYTLLRGSPASIPTITPDERDTLYTLFRLLDEMPAETPVERKPHRERQPGEPLRPGDDFNIRGSWETILKGWKKGKHVGGRQHWTRPGKDNGTSATTTESVLCCFSESAGLPAFNTKTRENALSKFSVYAALHHDGDFSAAASELRRQGYGDDPQELAPSTAPDSSGSTVVSAGSHSESRDDQRSTEDEWQPFPVELLPSGVRDYVTHTADGMACDPAMVALPMLAGLAAAIGNTRTITLTPDWQEPAIVWAAVVAESGSLKTPAARKALRFITDREPEIEHRNVIAMEQHEAKRTVYETQLAAWKQQSRKAGDNAGSPPTSPPKPARVAYIVSDTTIEAVAGILSDNPRGVLLERDELAGWMAGFDKYKAGGPGRVSSEVGHWLSMHNAGTLRLDRKSSGRVFVERASLSITGGIQPDTLTQAIGQEHVANGLLARFLLAAPPRRQKRFNTATADFAAVESTRRIFDTLYSLSAPDGGPVSLPLTQDGERVFQEFFERHAKRQLEASGAIASMLAKIEAAAARLALIHHVCRQAGDEPTLPSAVDATSVEVGVTLAEWFAAEWLRVYNATVGGSPKRDHDRELLEWIEQQGGEVAVRDIGQRIRRYRDTPLLERTITAMAQAGRLETFSIHNERGGPPAYWVRLPSVRSKPR